MKKIFVDKDQLLEDYKSGLTLEKISKKYGVTAPAIGPLLRTLPEYYAFREERRIRKCAGKRKIIVSFDKKFWGNVDKSGDCWIWTKYKIRNGYGMVYFRGKHTYAHRVSWTITFGEIPAGMCVCHTCDNPSCVNPSHLWIGTQTENIKDRDAKGRSKGGRRKK